MQKLTLTKRPAKIGKSINTRTEMHGKEEVPAHDIPISGLTINPQELALLCDRKDAYSALYMAGEGNIVIPRWSGIFPPFQLLHKFKGADVKVTLKGAPVLEFSNAGLKDIVLEGITGGNSAIRFKLQVTSRDNHLDVPGLLNAEISIAIRAAELETNGEDDEPELPLDHGEETPASLDAALERDEVDQQVADIEREHNIPAKRGRGRPRKIR